MNISILILLIVLLILYFTKREHFESNIVESHDFHIEAPGTFADEGSFTNDMQNYLNN
jgi:hypothetical protein